MYLPITQLPAEEQFKILEKKLDERVKIQQLVHESNPQYLVNREVVKKMCEEDFIFFCDNFCWIQDPQALDLSEKEIPFLLYKFQEESAQHIIEAVEKGYDLPCEKSRKMGMSWLSIYILVHGWAFKNWDVLVGSKKQSEVDTRGDADSLIGKARYCLQTVPDWLIPKLDQKRYDKSMLLVHPVTGAKFKGDSNNPEFGRGGRSTVILLDEFSSWPMTDRQAWSSTSSTANSRLCLSTPNYRGKNCYYYQIIKNAMDKGLPILRLHWSLHPHFADGLTYKEDGSPTSPWYENEVRRATSPIEVYQELDINYEASATGKVFSNFDYEKNVKESVPYNPNLPLFISWDFGLDQTALLWIQPDRANHCINIIDEYISDGTTSAGSDIFHYIDVVESKPYKRAIHFGDPHSGENRSLAARGSSNGNILRRAGFTFKAYNVKIITRIAAGRNLVEELRIDSNCTMAIEMFSSWQFKRLNTGNGQSSVPEHNNLSHIGDAYTYFCVGYQNQGKQNAVHEKKRNYSSTSGGVVG